MKGTKKNTVHWTKTMQIRTFVIFTPLFFLVLLRDNLIQYTFLCTVSDTQVFLMHQCTFFLVCSFMSFNKHITVMWSQPQSRHRTILPLPKVPSCPLIVPPTIPALDDTDLFSLPMVFPFPECHISGSIEYAAFWAWLLSFSLMPLRFIHLACMSINNPFLWWWWWL